MEQKITITLIGTSNERFALLNALHDIEGTPHSPSYPFRVRNSAPDKYTIVARQELCPKVWKVICEDPTVETYKSLVKSVPNANVTIKSNYSKEPVEKPKTITHMTYHTGLLTVQLGILKFHYTWTENGFA